MNNHRLACYTLLSPLSHLLEIP